MEITLPRQAAESGMLRIWLHRVPEASATVHAFRLGDDIDTAEPVGEAHVYGRGAGSEAAEKAMLIFKLRAGDLAPGEVLRLVIRAGDGGYETVDLDILSVE